MVFQAQRPEGRPARARRARRMQGHGRQREGLRE